MDGFSFCVTNNSSQKNIFFKNYPFNKKCNSAIELLEKIEYIFQKDEYLHLDYTNVMVVHHNSLATLVPNEYFKEEALVSYLQYHVKTLKTDFVAFDDVSEIDTKNVYIPYVNINNYLFQNFGEFEYRHHYSILIPKLLKLNNDDKNCMYVNVSKSEIDIFVIKNCNFVFSNSFQYYSKEDFAYYILFVAEQLDMDTAVFELYFLGAIETSSELYKIAYNYINNIYFLESNNSIFDELEISKHSNYTLLG